MAETLTLSDFDKLRDAVFQRAGDAQTSREEDQWLSLETKLGRMRAAAAQVSCRCGHARGAHRAATTVVSTCKVCHCKSFDAAEPGPAPASETTTTKGGSRDGR